jgi:inosine-uridine nucleoside N-ribohydrolase
MKIWIDTDTGIDDALALILAIQSPEIEVVGITAVHGNVDVKSAALNAKTIVDMLEAEVPVWQGAPLSLLGNSYSTPEAHGKDGLGDVVGSSRLGNVEPGFGPAVLAEKLRDSQDELTVVAIGPLTNTALALSYDPDCFHRHRLLIMGGAMLCEGNETPSAEFNTWCDPEAAHRVVHSGIPQIWISLDVTMKTIMPIAWCESLAKKTDDDLSRLVGEMTLYYSGWYKQTYDLDGFALHDPLAMGYLLWPSLFEMRQVYLDVERSGELCRGRTVPDLWQQTRPPKEENADIALDVEADVFIDRFCSHVPHLA